MKVIQVSNSLDYGDGVSNDIIHISEMLSEMRVENQIYTKWHNDKVKKYTADIRDCWPEKDDLVVYHYASKSYVMDAIYRFPCKVLVRYHNITPPEFFIPDNMVAYRDCKEGIEELKKNIRMFDGYIADSPFNAHDLISYGADPQKVDVLPIVIDFDILDSRTSDRRLCQELENSAPYMLYVGRIAPNKRVEDVLDIFESYNRYFDKKAKLYVVGNMDQSNEYTKTILGRLKKMESKDHVIFTGKVSDEDLHSYFSCASVFLCMSEHEGFCIPILEAQYYNVPVVAYASCAVPDTMGESGVLLYKKDPHMTAYIIDRILKYESLRTAIIERQQKNLAKYQRFAVKEQLAEILKKWRA